MTQYETLIQECEQAIRAGRIATAARKLTGLNYSQVPREWRLALARLSRRAGLFTAGLKFLTPLIRAADEKIKLKPSAQECAEYGACLQINGSIKEAIEVLNDVDAETVPDSLLYRAWCHFTRWEYADALPFLERYLQSPITPYWKVVGSVNYGAALAMLKQHDRALETIQFALHESHKGEMGRLRANCLELRAQVYLQSGQLERAESDLEEALRLLGLAKVQETLFIKKWQAVLAASRSGSSEPFEQLKAEAKSLSRWEIHREADLYLLKTRFNQKTFEHLLFGTAYPAYQKRALEELQKPEPPPYAVLGDESGKCFDVESGEVDGKLLFKLGCKTHQALEIILRDFYRPISVGGLFAELFPGEPFNIFSSPGRVHQILRRTRSWIEDSGLPLDLQEVKGTYHLQSTGAFAFRVPLHKESVDWCELHWRKLQPAMLNGKRLTASQIKKALSISNDEYRRLSEWAVDQGRLERVYDGSLPLYGCKKAA